MESKTKGKPVTYKEVVLRYYPDAIAKNIGCKTGDYYNIYSGDRYLGQGKTAIAAWTAAYRNLDN